MRQDFRQTTHRQALRAVRGEVGRLRLGFTVIAFYGVLPEAVRMFRSRYPDVEVDLVEMNSPLLEVAIAPGEIDLGVLHPPLTTPELVVHLLPDEPLVLALPATHRLAGQATVRVGDLDGEPFLLAPRAIGPSIYDRVIALFRADGISPRIVQEVTPMTTLAGLVAAGTGLGFVTAGIARVARPGVAYRPVAPPPPSLPMAAGASRPCPPAASISWKWLRHWPRRRIRTPNRHRCKAWLGNLDKKVSNVVAAPYVIWCDARNRGSTLPTEPRSPRLAVLIDADNASARIVDGLFEEIAKIGEASVRRIYGDFSSTRSKAWADVLSKHAIIPQQQFAYTTGKNASDITLVIDAMDLLHSGRFEGFCLVSSDSDFTRLAARIREQGIDVYGFGEQKTPESFRQACRRFVYTENLLPTAPANTQDAVPAKSLQPPSAATPIIAKVISQMETEDGWVPLGTVGNQLANLASDFDPRTFGFRKLSDLVRKTNAFEIVHPEGGAMRIRIKPAQEQTKDKPGRRRRKDLSDLP